MVWRDVYLNIRVLAFFRTISLIWDEKAERNGRRKGWSRKLQCKNAKVPFSRSAWCIVAYRVFSWTVL